MSDQPTSYNETREFLQREGSGGLADLFARHRARLRAALELRMHPRLLGRIDASDVIQEAFLEAHQRLEEYLQESPRSPYLWIRFLTMQRLQILHRRHLDAKQRDARREQSLNLAPSPEVSSVYLASLIIDAHDTPSEELQKAEQTEQLHEALEKMNATDREVLALRHFEQLENAEAAEVLGISADAASLRYYRALKKLKSILVMVFD